MEQTCGALTKGWLKMGLQMGGRESCPSAKVGSDWSALPGLFAQVVRWTRQPPIFFYIFSSRKVTCGSSPAVLTFFAFLFAWARLWLCDLRGTHQKVWTRCFPSQDTCIEVDVSFKSQDSGMHCHQDTKEAFWARWFCDLWGCSAESNEVVSLYCVFLV